FRWDVDIANCKANVLTHSRKLYTRVCSTYCSTQGQVDPPSWL
ncbi:unnamed protein product, partial [Heterotrigona itama]